MREHAVVVESGIEIASEAVETNLQIQDQEDRVVLVETLEGDR